MLSADDLRAELTGDERDLSQEPQVFVRIRRELLERMAGGRTTVVDATNLWPAKRGRHIRVARSLHRPVVAVLFGDVPLEELLARNAARPNPVHPGAVVTMSRQAASITAEQLLAEGVDAVLRAPTRRA